MSRIEEKEPIESFNLLIIKDSRQQRILESALYCYVKNANDQLKAHCDQFAPDETGEPVEIVGNDFTILQELSAQNNSAKMLWNQYLEAKQNA